jgi:hypothetical protein
MFKAAARTEIYGKTVYVMNELEAIEKVLQDFWKVYPALMDSQNVTVDDMRELKALKNELKQLNLSRGIVADYFSDFSEAWLDGYVCFKIRKPMIETDAEPLADEILKVCCSSNADNVQNNLSTLIEIYSIVIENGIMDASQIGTREVINVIESGDVINKITKELDKNPSMEHIDPSFLVISLMKKHFKETGYDQNYDLFVENVTNAIVSVQQRGYGSQEERTTAMASYMTKYLKDFNIQLSEKTVRYAAGYMLDAFNWEYPTVEAVDGIFRE